MTDRNSIFCNKYKLVKKLGTGCSGSVWKCTDGDSNFALKITDTDCSILGEKIAHRFLPKHVNLLDTIEVAENCVVYELCDCDLAALMPLDVETVRKFARDILAGINQLHRRKIVHGDIKPENILIKNNIAKLGDFGSTDFEFNLGDFIIGTRNYRAPESLLGMSQTSAIDMWAIGCLLFEIATDELLFDPRHNSKWGMSSIEVHLSEMVGLIGPMPAHMLNAKHASDYFSKKSKGRCTRHGAAHTEPLSASRFADLDHQLQDLIVKLLALNPQMRPTAHECLQHPFLKIEY